MPSPLLTPKETCCGCSACEQTCPKNCIVMQEDSEGFLYPMVNEELCVGCGACEKACPSLSPNESRRPLKALAAINKDEEIRRKSSSGGIFTLMAEKVLAQGGWVFGAHFNDSWEVVHGKTNRRDELDSYRGSKYVQSRIGSCFAEAEKLLKEGRFVMFVGTPCQIAGLHHFLGKSYDRLLTVDFICHGVPSPAVWRWYVKQVAGKLILPRWLYRLFGWAVPIGVIHDVEFRNKQQGWKQYQMLFKSKNGREKTCFHWDDTYMKAFLNNYDLRPSCYHCLAKEGRSHSDITLADFWNVHKVIDGFDDNKGTSLVLVNSHQGYDFLQDVDCRMQAVDFDDAIQYNPSWSKSYELNPKRQEFFYCYKEKFETLVGQV